MEGENYSIPEFIRPDPESLFLASRSGLRTYADLHHFKKYFHQLLNEHNADAERPVGFLCRSCDEQILAIASCWLLGIPFVCYNPDASTVELERQLRELPPSALFADRNLPNEPDTPKTLPIQRLDVEKVLSSEVKPIAPLEEQGPDPKAERIFGYFFTSGTSGFPKTVPLKRRQMLVAAAASAENFQPKSNHFWLLCLPLNHIGGISIILRSILYGSGIYRMDKFDPEMVYTFLSENSLFQAASMVPTMLKRLIGMQAFRTHHNFKAILLGGGPTDTSLLEKAAQKGVPVVSSYGMTETCAQIAANPLIKPSGMYAPLKSVGRLFGPNKIEIRDDMGRRLGPNNPGSIWLKGPQVFDGYLDTTLNERVFDDGGWFNTGDYGYMNRNKQLFIESRRSDLIITGGENVSPFEVESELKKIDPIVEAAVLGVPDEEWGQRVVAVVAARTRDEIETEQIRDRLKQRITSFKVPKQIVQIDTIPKNRSGKISREELLKFFK